MSTNHLQVKNLFIKQPQSHRKRCLIGCSGSVATVKVPELAVLLSAAEYDVLIVTTKNARFFLDRARDYNPEMWNKFLEVGGLDRIWEDIDEWESWNRIGDPVLHIELRRWADIIVIAPASADLLSKASSGITDNFLLSIMRAWDFQKPCIVCPAMNTFMWLHPSTNTSLQVLQSWGWKVVSPIEKKLACNDVGSGALAPVRTIIDSIFESLDGTMENQALNTTEKQLDESSSLSHHQASLAAFAQKSLFGIGITYMASLIISQFYGRNQ